jgi:hypothetical protein
MNYDQLHHQMEREAKRFAEHVCALSAVDPHSGLAEKVRDLEAGELASIFYLMAHERLPLEDALTQFTRVIAMRISPRPSGNDIGANALSTCGSFSNYHPRERIHLEGLEWGIVDNR